MTIRETQEEILRLKTEHNFCILAHTYQCNEITEITVFTGVSYTLSKKAQSTGAQSILMCGVHFMAETAKILSPEKRVFLANPDAGCPMVEQMDEALIRQLRESHPGHTVVAYIKPLR